MEALRSETNKLLGQLQDELLDEITVLKQETAAQLIALNERLDEVVQEQEKQFAVASEERAAIRGEVDQIHKKLEDNAQHTRKTFDEVHDQARQVGARKLSIRVLCVCVRCWSFSGGVIHFWTIHVFRHLCSDGKQDRREQTTVADASRTSHHATLNPGMMSYHSQFVVGFPTRVAYIHSFVLV